MDDNEKLEASKKLPKDVAEPNPDLDEIDKTNESISEPESEEPVSDEEIEQIIAQYDRESNTRHFAGVPKTIVRYICVAFALFGLGINIGRIDIFGLIELNMLLPPQVHRSLFVGLLIFMAFLVYPAKRKNNIKVNYIPWYDFILAIAGTTAFLYHALRFDTIARQMAVFTQLDIIMALIGIVVLFVICYRVVGWPVLVVVALFIGYAYFGVHIPGRFGHAGYRWERIVTFLFYTTEGVIGTPTMVASTFIFVFIMFAAFLVQTGVGAFFIDIANAITGRSVGGPAKMVVIASALQGTICGSSVANTVASGSLTIPLMKRLGYEKNFAGAVEAASSTGGQVMPPVMGAATFLMAEITGIPFRQIALAATIPTLLYFTCVLASIHFEAKKIGLRGMPEDEIPKFWPLMRSRGHLLLPIFSIVFFLAQGFTPTRSAFFAILTAIIVSSIRKDTRMSPKKFVNAMETGVRNVIGVGIACAMAGMIVGVVVLTGLGLTFANSMIALAGNIANDTWRMFLVLFCTMVASLLLGLGVPTTAKYVIVATVTAPILTRYPIGLPILVAHMFVLYFGTDADITPPVGLAGYAAAAISRGEPIRTCVIATRLAAAGYIIPFFFAFNPQMLLIDAYWWEVLWVTVSALAGIIFVAAGLSGYFIWRMRWWERLMIIGAGLALIDYGVITYAVAVALVLGVVASQKVRSKLERTIAV